MEFISVQICCDNGYSCAPRFLFPFWNFNDNVHFPSTAITHIFVWEFVCLSQAWKSWGICNMLKVVLWKWAESTNIVLVRCNSFSHRLFLLQRFLHLQKYVGAKNPFHIKPFVEFALDSFSTWMMELNNVISVLTFVFSPAFGFRIYIQAAFVGIQMTVVCTINSDRNTVFESK